MVEGFDPQEETDELRLGLFMLVYGSLAVSPFPESSISFPLSSAELAKRRNGGVELV
jgi:hypothetical protein